MIESLDRHGRALAVNDIVRIYFQDETLVYGYARVQERPAGLASDRVWLDVRMGRPEIGWAFSKDIEHAHPAEAIAWHMGVAA